MKDDPCVIAGCLHTVGRGGARGMCPTHYSRWRKHGDPELGARPTYSDTCSVDGCEKPRYQRRQMCSTHVMRQHRYGEVHADRTREAAPFVIQSHGYKKHLRKGHPLADGDGYVYEQREVLFATIGPGTHPCHWCSNPVTWGDGLEADHVDHDRLNNDPTNLVPSCHGCNTRRALDRRWHGAA